MSESDQKIGAAACRVLLEHFQCGFLTVAQMADIRRELVADNRLCVAQARVYIAERMGESLTLAKALDDQAHGATTAEEDREPLLRGSRILVEVVALLGKALRDESADAPGAATAKGV